MKKLSERQQTQLLNLLVVSATTTIISFIFYVTLLARHVAYPEYWLIIEAIFGFVGAISFTILSVDNRKSIREE